MNHINQGPYKDPGLAPCIVVLSKQVYCDVKSAICPASRFINTEWKFQHFWLYDAQGKVVIFVWEPIPADEIL